MTNRTKRLVVAFLCCLMLSTAVFAGEDRRVITPLEAIGLAFERNLEHSFFLWEQSLAAKREALVKKPVIAVTAEPIKIDNGRLQEPSGSLTFKLPLDSGAALDGTLNLRLDQTGLTTSAKGDLSLEYQFFATGELPTGELSAEEMQLRQENNLILQALDLLIRLRQALDQKSLTEQEHGLLERTFQAAMQTPGYDTEPIIKDLKGSEERLAQQQSELAELQLELARFLDEPDGTAYDPLVEFSDLNASFQADKLRQEWFSASTAWRKAEADLKKAQAELEYEQKTMGWQVAASGGIDQDLKWDVGLTASKTLYPRSVVLEELELALTRAERAFETAEIEVSKSLQAALKKVSSAQSQLLASQEKLEEMLEKWELSQRQLAAGLITELQLEEVRLALLEAEYARSHRELDLGIAVLELLSGCGRPLAAVLLEVLE